MVGMSLTKHSSINFEIVVTQHNAACRACQTPGVKLLAPISFKILTFDATVARLAEGAVELVVVVLAVRGVVEDVEFGAWEGTAAGPANETVPVVSTS